MIRDDARREAATISIPETSMNTVLKCARITKVKSTVLFNSAHSAKGVHWRFIYIHTHILPLATRESEAAMVPEARVMKAPKSARETKAADPMAKP
jgi:hypothetical protein